MTSFYDILRSRALTRQHYFQERLQSLLPQHPAQYGIATGGTKQATNKASYDPAQSHSTSNAQSALHLLVYDGPALKIIRKI